MDLVNFLCVDHVDTQFFLKNLMKIISFCQCLFLGSWLSTRCCSYMYPCLSLVFCFIDLCICLLLLLSLLVCFLILCCFHYNVSVICLEVWNGNSSSIIFVLSYYSGLIWVSEVFCGSIMNFGIVFFISAKNKMCALTGIELNI